MQQYPFIFSEERNWRIRRHAALWVSWWLFCSILYAYHSWLNPFPHFSHLLLSMIDALFFLIPHMFLSYSLMYFVIPRFIFTGRYISAVVFVLILFVLTACISAVIGLYILPEVRQSAYDTLVWRYPKGLAFFLSLLAGLRGAITIGGLAAAIKLMKYYYLKEQRNLQLQKENAESQLQLLKAQVHPHFLFNTLNNIYSHTQNTSPVASKLVTGLSDMLRFILYECNQPLVPLSKELKMIRDYINLEKIRYDDKLELHLDFPEQTNDLYIAPLLLLPLVENAFKHGTSKMLEQPWISLQIIVHNKQMQMKLINGKVNEPKESLHRSGIGIQNVRKRLALLYSGKHELSTNNDEEVFIVNLKIELDQRPEIKIKRTNLQDTINV